jgi:hypothetical protein
MRKNIFGPATIAGVSYPANGDKIGMRATDSGRSDRVDLSNVRVENNNMNGDRIVTCGGPVVCTGNTVSTRLAGLSLLVFGLPDPSAFFAKEISAFSKRVLR